jgi:hypothetical protein
MELFAGYVDSVVLNQDANGSGAETIDESLLEDLRVLIPELDDELDSGDCRDLLVKGQGRLRKDLAYIVGQEAKLVFVSWHGSYLDS